MIRSSLLGDLVNLGNSLDQVTNRRWGGSHFDRSNDASWSAPIPIDVYSTGDHVTVIAAVPGMRPEDLELTVHQNTVTLRGKVLGAADAEETTQATWYVSELGSGSYQRSVTLPFPIDADGAHATFDHGLVRVILPKADSAKPRTIAINNGPKQQLAAGNPAA